MWLNTGKQIMNPFPSESGTYLGLHQSPTNVAIQISDEPSEKGFPGVGLLTTTPGDNQGSAERSHFLWVFWSLRPGI